MDGTSGTSSGSPYGRRLRVGPPGARADGFETVELAPGEAGLGAAEGRLRAARGTVDVLVCDHALDGLAPGDAARLLRAFRWALSDGGVLRLRVPPGSAGARADLLRRAGWVGLERHPGPSPAGLEAAPAGDGPFLDLRRPRRDDAEAPLVSILIPAYKPAFFREALESALAQTWPSLEIVVSDDSGGTAIESLVREVAGADPRVRYHRNPERLGGRGNYLRCLELARGAYVKYLNDDDVLLPGCVERMARCLAAYPEVTLVTSHRQPVDGRGLPLRGGPATRRIALQDARIDGPSAVDLMLEAQVNFIGEPSTPMFRRADVADLSPHLMSFAGEAAVANGDTHVWASLLSKGDLIYLTDTLSLFRQHDDQVQRDPAFRERGLRAWDTLAERSRLLGFRTSGPMPRLDARPLGARPWWPREARRAYEEARAARGEREELRAWEELLALLPDEPWVACEAARLRLSAGDPAGAAAAATAAIRRSPAYLPGYAWLGFALARAGREREGRRILERGCAEGLPWLLWGDRNWSGGPARLHRPWFLWFQTGGLPARISLEIALHEAGGGGPLRLPVATGEQPLAERTLRRAGEAARVEVEVPEGRDQTVLRLGPAGGTFAFGRLDVDLRPPAGEARP